MAVVRQDSKPELEKHGGATIGKEAEKCKYHHDPVEASCCVTLELAQWGLREGHESIVQDFGDDGVHTFAPLFAKLAGV